MMPVELQSLAQEMGVAVEVLWAALVRQAPISSAVETFLFLAFATVLVATCRRGLSYDKAINEDREPAFFVRVVIVVVSSIYVLAFLLSAGDIIAGFVNPEYWATAKVLRLLGK